MSMTLGAGSTRGVCVGMSSANATVPSSPRLRIAMRSAVSTRERNGLISSPHIVRADSGQYCSSRLENLDRWAYCQFGLDRGASVASLPEAVQKPVTLGERVRAARHALGLSQAQLAGDELTIFFSSRRRHTIFDCDWSSDVCSSD